MSDGTSGEGAGIEPSHGSSAWSPHSDPLSNSNSQISSATGSGIWTPDKDSVFRLFGSSGTWRFSGGTMMITESSFPPFSRWMP